MYFFFNILGFAWVFLSYALSQAFCMLFQLENESIQLLVAGMLMIVFDLSWRVLVDADPRIGRLLWLRSGGYVGLVPIWITGFVVVAGAILLNPAG